MNTELHALSGAYALDAVSEIERRLFDRHLVECETCQEDVNDYVETASRLVELVPSATPPSAMKESLLEQIRQTAQERPQYTKPKHTTTGSPAVRRLSVAAAALLVAASSMGVVAYNNAQQADQLTAAAENVAAIINAEDAETVQGSITGGGTGSLVVSRSLAEAVVVTTGLEAAPAGSTYQLWAINDDGARSRGLLDPQDKAAAGQVIEWPADAGTFGMTIEPAGGSAAPTTEPILILEVPV